MQIIIDFNKIAKNNTKAKRISLSNFNIAEKYVDVTELYSNIDKKYKIKLKITSGKELLVKLSSILEFFYKYFKI